jgi:hypothetical protein
LTLELDFVVNMIAARFLPAYFQGKKKAIVPATAAPKTALPIKPAKLRFGFGDILLNIKPTISQTTKNATPTAKCKGSHTFKKLPTIGAHKPPIKQGSHSRIESPAFVVCRSVIRSYNRNKLTVELTRRKTSAMNL